MYMFFNNLLITVVLMYMAIGAYKNAVYGMSLNTNEDSDSDEKRNVTSQKAKNWVRLGWIIISLRIISWFVIVAVFYNGIIVSDNGILDTTKELPRHKKCLKE